MSRPIGKALLRVGLQIICLVAIGWIALRVGDEWGQRRRLSIALEEERSKLQQHLKGLSLGQPFPRDLVLWDSAGTTATYIEELMPHGGVLLFAGSDECPTCEAAFDTLQQILTRHNRIGEGTQVVIVLDEQPQNLLSAMRNRGIRFPVLWDQPRDLRLKYGVPSDRVFFKINEQWTVEDLGRFNNNLRMLRRLVQG